jgi:hypothetical protein
VEAVGFVGGWLAVDEDVDGCRKDLLKRAIREVIASWMTVALLVL